MPLVKDGAIAADPYTRIADDAEVPGEGAVFVSAERFLAHADALVRRNGPVGVLWPNHWEVADLQPWLDRIAAVALHFPTFKDGRAFSQARLLRERYRYRNELRATGQVLRDQFVFMLRSGFDAFEVKKLSDAEAFCDAASRYSVFYQPTGDGRISALRQRMLRHSRASN